MTKIKNKSAYPIKVPNKRDYFVGTDSDSGGKTVNFDFKETAKLIGVENGVLALEYVFSTASDIDVEVLTGGKFLSNSNKTAISEITKLYINRETADETDIVNLLAFIGTNHSDFLVKLRNKENPNDSVYLNILSVESFPSYSVFHVDIHKQNSAFTTLHAFGRYIFDFVFKAGGTDDSVKNQVKALAYPDGVTKATTPEITDGIIYINSYDFGWNVGNAPYENSLDYEHEIVECTEGFSKFIVVSGDSEGDIFFTEGVESGSAVKPAVPEGSIELSFIEVNGSVINEPVIMSTGRYQEKAELNATDLKTAGIAGIVTVNGKSSRLVVNGSVTVISGIKKTSECYDGQIFLLENKQTTAITLKHNDTDSGSGFKCFFYNDRDFVLNPNQIARFTINLIYNRLDYVGVISDVDKEYVDEVDNDLQDQITAILGAVTVHPAYIAPSSSLSIANQTVEVGSTVSVNITQSFVQNDAGSRVSDVISKNGSTIANASTFSESLVMNTTPVIYGGSVAHGQGIIKNNNIGLPDTVGRINSGNTISPVKTLTPIYPVFYGVSTSLPAVGQALINSGTKLVSASSGTVTVTFGATLKYLWFAIPVSSPAKTNWMVSATNFGNIGGSSNLFNTEQQLSVNSPTALWNGIVYRFYISNYQTTTSGTMDLKN